MINYARKIKEYRERKFLTQVELAELLGVGKSSITRWENGQFEPTRLVKEKIRLICEENNIQMEEIKR